MSRTVQLGEPFHGVCPQVLGDSNCYVLEVIEDMPFSFLTVLSTLVEVYQAHLRKALEQWSPKVEGDPFTYLSCRACYVSPTSKKLKKNKLVKSWQ